MEPTFRYKVRPVHKIAPREDDAFVIRLGSPLETDRKAVATTLRANGVLASGERVRFTRVEGEQIVAFPSHASVWHSVVISPV